MWGLKSSPGEFILNYKIKQGTYAGYRLLFEKHKFYQHQVDYKERWWYQDSGWENFINNLIPQTFETSKCICPSNHRQLGKFCIYKLNSESPVNYLKIPFCLKKFKKVIIIYTYNITPNISEPLCKKLIQ